MAAFGASLIAFVVIAAGSPQRASAAYFYCNKDVPPGYECGPFNVYDADANVNQAYEKQEPGYPVCERATVRYHAANISYRCGGSPVDSGCDMLYSEYGPGVEFSMYTINDAPSDYLYNILVGKAYYSTGVCA